MASGQHITLDQGFRSGRRDRNEGNDSAIAMELVPAGRSTTMRWSTKDSSAAGGSRHLGPAIVFRLGG